MKLLRINGVYTKYAEQFYAERPGLAEQSLSAQKAELDEDHFGVGNSLSVGLAQLGYEVTEVYPSLEPLQRAWAKEEGLDPASGYDAVVAQAKKFRPDVLCYEFYDSVLLGRILEAIPSIRLVLGWEGSALSAAGPGAKWIA